MTYSGGTDSLVNLYLTAVIISNDLTQMVNFLLESLAVTLTVLNFGVYLLTQVFVLQ